MYYITILYNIYQQACAVYNTIDIVDILPNETDGDVTEEVEINVGAFPDEDNVVETFEDIYVEDVDPALNLLLESVDLNSDSGLDSGNENDVLSSNNSESDDDLHIDAPVKRKRKPNTLVGSVKGGKYSI